ncbi:MAG: hypothetical protein C0592_03495 [Marinilabiliales bacterium]|nr:MAG: hypothetical protein C0592_03495 [Marinilabiliales bacterium]
MRKLFIPPLFILAAFFLMSCSNSSSSKNKDNTDSISENNNSDTIQIGDEDFATYFIVVADTGVDYYVLRKMMMKIKKKHKMEIDTMGRYYDEDKGMIVLPENDEDEIYAGDYFPRRMPSETLSLEYLDLYQRKAGERTIALVCGIYENENSADSLQKTIKKTAPGSFVIETEMFIGCLH